MILAERTAQIAAEAAHGQDQAAGKEPLEWFFLDRVQSQGGDPAIVVRFHAAISGHPTATEAKLPF